jgi:hypothetical protein
MNKTMKRTIRLNESDLRGMIRDVILETFENRMENTPDPKYEVGDTVAVEYAADRMFGPDGQPAKIGAREWNGKDGVWMYFCMHPRLPRRGWWSEDQLQPFQHESLNEDYSGENELWNAAKNVLDCGLMLNAIEHYLDSDGLLDEYAQRLQDDFDVIHSYN